MKRGNCGRNQSPSTGDMWVPFGLAMFPSALSPTCCTWHACGDVYNCRLGLSVACTTSGVHMQLHPLTQWARWLMVQTKPNMACHTLPRMTSQRRMVSSTRWVLCITSNRKPTMSEPIGCVCVCVWIDKTVCCPCAWGVCQCVLVLREHAQWDKCRCGSYAQVLHDCWLADVRCKALKSVPPSPSFFLVVISRTLLAYIEKNGKLPSTWFLQLDNTCK